MTETAPPKAKRPWWRRWLRRLGYALVALLTLALLWVAWKLVEPILDRPGLNRYRAKLDEQDPNWRLEAIVAGREDLDNRQNSARLVQSVIDDLPKSWPPARLDAGMSLPGAPGYRRHDKVLAELRAELAKWREPLERARSVHALPRGRFELTLVGSLVDAKSVEPPAVQRVLQLLRFDASLQAHDAKWGEAELACLAMLNVGRSVGNEPTFQAQTIRISGAIAAIGGLQEILDLGTPSADALRSFQQVLADEEREVADAGVWVWRGERAILDRRYSDLATGRTSLAEFREAHTNLGHRFESESMRGWLWWKSLPSEHRAALEMMTEAAEIARLPPHEQNPREIDMWNRAHNLGTRWRWQTSNLWEVDLVGTMFRSRLALLRIARVALAVEWYRAIFGRWPQSLEEVVPRFLARIPDDPFDGKPIRFLLREDRVTVYSVSLDKKDDGGKVVNELPPRWDTDVGLILVAPVARSKPFPAREEGR